MSTNHLAHITTQWSEMEFLIAKDGPAALADFLAAKYFHILAAKFKAYLPNIDELGTHELASDVLYEFIKNDYHNIKRLDRNRGHLRGLFFAIIKNKLYRLKKSQKITEDIEHIAEGQTEDWIDICLDFDDALIKLKEQRPRLYQPFISHYLEGKSLAQIADVLGLEVNAVKQRLYSARRALAEWLNIYA